MSTDSSHYSYLYVHTSFLTIQSITESFNQCNVITTTSCKYKCNTQQSIILVTQFSVYQWHGCHEHVSVTDSQLPIYRQWRESKFSYYSFILLWSTLVVVVLLLLLPPLPPLLLLLLLSTSTAAATATTTTDYWVLLLLLLSTTTEYYYWVLLLSTTTEYYYWVLLLSTTTEY